MKNFNRLPALLCLLFISSLYAVEDGKTKLNHSIDKTVEETVYARINMDHGLLDIQASSAVSGLFSGEFLFDTEKPEIEYRVVDDEGRLVIHVSDDRYDEDGLNIDFDDFDANECRLNFSNNVALSLKMKCGMMKGNLDLSDLKIANCSLTAAAGKATIDFGKPNTVDLNKLDVENGLGKLSMYNLANANFSSFDFEAGIGSYILDFGGKLQRSANVDVELGMGSMTIYLPRDIAARIEIEDTFLTSLTINDVFKNGDIYTTENWEKADTRLDMRVSCSVGELVFKWID
ncbi:MAG: hypothetical protein ACRBF0_22105 [Calditrichia bacterium]